MQIYFLTADDVLQVHVDQVTQYGGEPSVRDKGLLESAIQMPRSSFDGALLHPTIFEMAAAYLYHIVRNHPFVDGNKRTGTVAAIMFLDFNGIEVDADEAELVELVLSVVAGVTTKQQVADFLRTHAVHT